MRVLLGLAALAASANAQVTVSVSGSAQGVGSTQVSPGETALASLAVFYNTQNGTPAPLSPALAAGVQYQQAGNWVIPGPSTAVPFNINTIVFVFTTNAFTAQMQHRWGPNYPNPTTICPTCGLTSTSYICDLCAGGSVSSCNTSTGPGPTGLTPVAGFNCAQLQRVYTLTNLAVPTAQNPNGISSFSVQLLDRNQNPGPNTSSYSFTIVHAGPPIIGDPQIYGLQGQDFQVHGVPDEIFNMVTYPNLQVNARFVYLSSGECLDNYTACFAHPGTYISEEGIRLGTDKIHVRAGSAKKGLTVAVNGKKLSVGKQNVKLGSVELVNHRRVSIRTPVMEITLTNSDKFLNQESNLYDQKLLALGAERRVLKDEQKFHSEVPLHGLQGQTWRNVEYPSGLEYEGTISDYQIQDGNLFGTGFVFNQFQS